MASFRNFVITVVLMSLFSTLFFAFIYEGSDNYNVDVPTEYRRGFDAFNETVNNTLKVGKETRDAAADIAGGTLTGIGGGVIKGTAALVKVLKLPFDLIGDLYDLMVTMAVIIHIPEYIVKALYAILLIFVSYLLVEAILRFKNT